MTPQFEKAIRDWGPRFIADLGITRLQVAGMLGNFGVESDQFRALQEYVPAKKGSRGGWGPPQWTGPRRRAFEGWAKANGHRLDSMEGFYAYILIELRSSEKRALTSLKRTTTLDTATVSFMNGFERPGKPHLSRRKELALEALRVLDKAIGGVKTDPGKSMPTPRSADPWTPPPNLWASTATAEPAPAVPAPVTSELTPLTALGGAKGTLSGLWALATGQPPVPVADRKAVRAEVREAAPGVAKELGGIKVLAAGGLFSSMLGGITDSGALDGLKGQMETAAGTFQSAKDLIDIVARAVLWCVGHWWIFGIAVSLYLLVRVGWAAFKIWVQIRQGLGTFMPPPIASIPPTKRSRPRAAKA